MHCVRVRGDGLVYELPELHDVMFPSQNLETACHAAHNERTDIECYEFNCCNADNTAA